MIKIFAFQLFKGLSYLHNVVGVAHCDIKPSNILFNEDECILKICDFGPARIFAKKSQNINKTLNYISYSAIHPKQSQYDFSRSFIDININNSTTSNEYDYSDDDASFIIRTAENNDFANQKIQTTIPYRAPEILYECQNIDSAPVDIWSAGCVIVEMLRGNGKKLFSTSKSIISTHTVINTKMLLGSYSSPIDQLNEIISILGQPKLSDFDKYEHSAIIVSAKRTISLEKVLPKSTPKELVSLLKRILVFCPEERPSANECLNSSFFDDIIGKDNIQMPNGKKAPRFYR